MLRAPGPSAPARWGRPHVGRKAEEVDRCISNDVRRQQPGNPVLESDARVRRTAPFICMNLAADSHASASLGID